ncbi:MAG TPA: hypothetical protein VJ351_23075 [Streptosporangiaceae bacterium]|nr:hypothetical protein [Streptosporangiaceae bacterium]
MPPRLPNALASVLAAAGIVLAVASCGNIAPLGPSGPSSVAPPAQPPPPLRSPFILEAVRIQAPTSAGGCPSGSVALSGGPGQCYGQLGTPVTITSAFVGSVVTGTSHIPPGQYGFWVTLPAADLPALHALTTAAYNAQGFLGISVAGQTWLLPRVRAPFTGPLEMVLPTKDQVLLLHSLLFPGPVAQPAPVVVSPGT